MSKKFTSFVGLLLLLCSTLTAQVVTTSPVFPTENDLVTITFDATQGTGGLNNCTTDVYIHTGVITNLSTSNTDWKYVKAGWTTNVPACKMTRSATNPNIYTITLPPSVRDFYGVGATETAQKIAMVFRNATSTLEGKGTGGTDILAPLYAAGSPLLTIFQSPASDYGVYNIGSNINLQAAASIAANCSFYLDGVQIGTPQTNTTTLQYTLPVTTGGDHVVKFVAIAGAQRDSTTFH